MGSLSRLVLVVGGLAAFAYFSTGRDEGNTTAKRDVQCDRITAFVMSQTFVERRLKAPSTASFPYASSDGVSIEERGNCTFSIRAYVDAENSFGANLRMPYSMDIRRNQADDTWSASNIQMN